MNAREFILLLRRKLLTLPEIVSLLFAFLLVPIIVWVTGTNGYVHKFVQFIVIKEFAQFIPLSINWIKLILWLVVAFLIRQLIKRFSLHKKRGKHYVFNCYDWEKFWIFHGKSHACSSPHMIVVDSSRAGCLLKQYVWKNFEMSFDMKFLKEVSQKHIGIIFRAKDLENYFMLEIKQVDGLKHCVAIRPHIRVHGAWEITRDFCIGELDLTEFKKIKLRAINEYAYLYIKDKEKLMFEWHLPTHVDINHVEAGVKSVPENITSRGFIPKIDFRISYGMIGFRAHPEQGAKIKELEIKSINAKYC